MSLFSSRKVLSFCLFLLISAAAFSQGAGAAFYKKGKVLERQKNYEEAAKLYAQAYGAEPDNYKYYYAEGMAYYKMKRNDVAITSFEKAIEKNPDFTNAYSLIGKIYTKQKEYDKAISYYDGAYEHESNPKKKVQYKLLIVQMLMKLKRTDDAMSHIEDAKNVDPNNLNILYYDAKLSNANGNHAQAKESMLIATGQLADAPPAKAAKFYYELGLAYNELGDFQNAKKAWDKANFGSYRKKISVQLSKNSPVYFYRAAVSYFLVGEYTKSEEKISEALNIQSNFSPAYILRGKIAKKQGNFAEAVSNYKEAASIEDDPTKKAKLQLQYVGMQIDAGDYSGALRTCNSILGVSSGNKRAMYYKGFAQYKLGNYSSCISTMEILLSSGSVDAKSRAQYNMLLGLAASKNNNTSRAKDAFKVAMAGGPYKAAAKSEYDKLKENK